MTTETASAPLDLEEIRRALEGVTPGPWVMENGDPWGPVVGPAGEMVALVYARDGREKRWYWECETNTKRFVAQARTWVPALLAEVERLTRERDEARSYPLAEEERRKLTGDALYAEGERAAAESALAEARAEVERLRESLIGAQKAEATAVESAYQAGQSAKRANAEARSERQRSERYRKALAAVKAQVRPPDGSGLSLGEILTHVERIADAALSPTPQTDKETP